MENSNQELNSKNELGNIILDKNSSSLKNKKIILAVATLSVILIVVVVIMNKISVNEENTLPKPILPPEPQEQTINDENSLFKPVEVVEEDSDDNLDKIAEKLKKESLLEDEFVEDDIVVIDEPVPTQQQKIVNQPKKETPKPVVKKEVKKQKPAVKSNYYYVQVGSFSRYEPNKKFLNSITKLGYTYEYKKVLSHGRTLNKVLIGPFKNEKEARSNLNKIRKNVISGAFLIKG